MKYKDFFEFIEKQNKINEVVGVNSLSNDSNDDSNDDSKDDSKDDNFKAGDVVKYYDWVSKNEYDGIIVSGPEVDGFFKGKYKVKITKIIKLDDEYFSLIKVNDVFHMSPYFLTKIKNPSFRK